MNALDLFTQRRSVRAYLPTPVSEDLLGQIMTTARLAPSGANLQPGVFLAVRGAVRQQLCDALAQAWREGRQETEDYDYFPKPMPMTLRRRQVAAAQEHYKNQILNEQTELSDGFPELGEHINWLTYDADA